MVKSAVKIDSKINSTYQKTDFFKWSKLISDSLTPHERKCSNDFNRLTDKLMNLDSFEHWVLQAQKAYSRDLKFDKLNFPATKATLIKYIGYLIAEIDRKIAETPDLLKEIEDLIKICSGSLGLGSYEFNELNKLGDRIKGLPGKKKELEDRLGNIKRLTGNSFVSQPFTSSGNKKLETEHFPTLSFPDVGNILIGAEKILEVFGALNRSTP